MRGGPGREEGGVAMCEGGCRRTRECSVCMSSADQRAVLPGCRGRRALTLGVSCWMAAMSMALRGLGAGREARCYAAAASAALQKSLEKSQPDARQCSLANTACTAGRRAPPSPVLSNLAAQCSRQVATPQAHLHPAIPLQPLTLLRAHLPKMTTSARPSIFTTWSVMAGK